MLYIHYNIVYLKKQYLIFREKCSPFCFLLKIKRPLFVGVLCHSLCVNGKIFVLVKRHFYGDYRTFAVDLKGYRIPFAYV